MLTVDLEPDWGRAGTTAVREILPRFRELLDSHGVRATFFVTASLLDTCGDVLRPLVKAHEIGSHGLTHRPLDALDDSEVAEELAESRRRLREALGVAVNGFRAPFLKTPDRWLGRLAAAGYRYDSSVGCVAPSWRNARPGRWRAEERDGVWEIPTTTLATGFIPFSLTWLRVLAPLGERLISSRAAIMYLHLHELADPKLADGLPLPLRLILSRGVGERAWRIVERVVRRIAPRAMTCSEFLGCDS